jgi:RsiW-degrading membrane proteinase PrsW (M82 family)
MAAQVCCVDQQRPGTHTIAGRWFCEEHYNKAVYHRKGVWRTAVAAVIALLIFVAAVVALDTVLKPKLSGGGLVVTGVILALVPAALWLIFFYQQDRLEPEPVGFVVRMFVIGLALAGAIGIPLTDQLFAVQNWLYRDATTTWLASIFITGAVAAFIIYAAVRYFMFDEAEFDERTDGVIYATAAALGYASALNLQFILSNGGARLGTGEIFVAEVALAYAAFGGLLGYFLGRAKLEQDPVWWLPLGLVLTALLGGLFVVLRGQLEPGTIQIAGSGSGLPSFNGLILAGVLAVIVTVIVSYLITRDINRSLNNKQPAVTVDPTVGDRQANYATVGVFALMLIIGGLTWSNAVNRTTSFNAQGIQGSYPAYFSPAARQGEVFRAVDTVGTGAEFIIAAPALAAGQDASAVANQLAGSRSTDYSLYKVLSTGKTTVNGKQALTQRFAYVDPNGLTGAAPQVHQGVDYIFVANGKAVVVTMLTTPDQVATVEPLFARFLNSVNFQ